MGDCKVQIRGDLLSPEDPHELAMLTPDAVFRFSPEDSPVLRIRPPIARHVGDKSDPAVSPAL